MVAEHLCDMPWRAPQEQVSERICERLVTKLGKFRPKVCRVLPMVHCGANERGNTMEKLTIFQKIFNLQKLVLTQDLQENVSEGQHSIAIPNVHVEGYGTTSSCREDTYPQNDERLVRKSLFEEISKLVLCGANWSQNVRTDTESRE